MAEPPTPPRPAPRALAVTGPTTSGKTALSLGLAHRLGAEIIGMDSRQVYRGLDVGTDKLPFDEREGIPHHGLDLVDPSESYSAGRFGRDARRWIADIETRGKVPLLVGGTGFFLRAVVEPIFREPPLDPKLRARVRARLRAMDIESLSRWARQLDPDRSRVAREGGRQRLARTIEVALLTGRPLSWWHREAPPDGPAVPCLVVLLRLERSELDKRIDARVSRMMDRGLVEEVKGLLARGYGPDAPGMSGTGYRELAAYVGGSMTLEAALADMRRQTRRYARRQLTWFRNQLPADAVRVDASLPVEDQVTLVCNVWLEAGSGVGGR